MGGIAKALDEARGAVLAGNLHVALVIGGKGFLGLRPASDCRCAGGGVEGERAVGLKQALGKAAGRLSGVAGNRVEQDNLVRIRIKQGRSRPFAAARVQPIGQGVAAIVPLTPPFCHQPDAGNAVACLGIGQGLGGEHKPDAPVCCAFSAEFGGGPIGKLQRPQIPQVNTSQNGSHVGWANGGNGVGRAQANLDDMIGLPTRRCLYGVGG